MFEAVRDADEYADRHAEVGALPQSKEELIEQSRRISVQKLRDANEAVSGLQSWLADVQNLFELPGLLDGSLAVQCFALLHKLRKAFQDADRTIEELIGTQTKDRKPGLLQGVILAYGEETNRTNFGRVEGLTIHLSHFLSVWIAKENAEKLESDPELGYLVKREPVVNTSSLTAAVRERLKLATEVGREVADVRDVLPEDVRDIIGVIDTYHIKAKKG